MLRVRVCVGRVEGGRVWQWVRGTGGRVGGSEWGAKEKMGKGWEVGQKVKE